MALVETESLVLKSYNLAEADRIVVLLTKDQGVVRGVAKGAKRLRSKFGSGLEPFSQVHVTYFQKDAVELVSLQKIELIQSSFREASDPEFLQKFSYLSELVISILPPHDPSELLYRMFKACLAAASTSRESNHRSLGVYFEIWLLKISGYMPDWSRCDVCGTQFDLGGDLSLGRDFHVSCLNCSPPRSVNAVTSRERELVMLAQKVSPADFHTAVSGYSAELDHLSVTLKRMISQAIGREVVAG